MLKKPEEYPDGQAILEEMAERAEKDIGTEHRSHYQEDIRWLITKLISESERPIATFYDLDAVPEPENLRSIGGVLSILGKDARRMHWSLTEVVKPSTTGCPIGPNGENVNDFACILAASLRKSNGYSQ